MNPSSSSTPEVFLMFLDIHSKMDSVFNSEVHEQSTQKCIKKKYRMSIKNVKTENSWSGTQEPQYHILCQRTDYPTSLILILINKKIIS